MKKILLVLMAVAVCHPAWGAGSCQVGDLAYINNSMAAISVTCTADSADGSVPATEIDPGEAADGYYLYEVRTSPGATAPTDSSDFTLVNGSGLDLLGGAGANKIDATSELNFIPEKSDGGYFYPVVNDSALTLTVTNNSVESAIFTIKFIFVK